MTFIIAHYIINSNQERGVYLPQTAENGSFIEFLLSDWLMTIKMDGPGQSYYLTCFCECLFSFFTCF